MHPDAYVNGLKIQVQTSSRVSTEEIGFQAEGQKRRYDATVQPREFQVGQKVLLLLPSSNEKLLLKWQGQFVITARKGEVDVEICVPHVD